MELEEAKKYLKHEVEVYEDNKEINQLIGGKAGKIQYEVYKAVLQALEELQQKEKSRIIGNINEIKIEDLEPILKSYYIPKEKVENKIEIYKRLELESFNRDSIQADEYRAIIKVLQELLEE